MSNDIYKSFARLNNFSIIQNCSQGKSICSPVVMLDTITLTSSNMSRTSTSDIYNIKSYTQDIM